MVRAPAPVVIGDPGQTAIIAIAPSAVRIRPPIRRDFGRPPALAVALYIHPFSVRIQCFVRVKRIARHPHVIRAGRGETRGQPAAFSWRSLGFSTGCRRPELFARNNLVCQRVKTKGRAAVALRNRDARSRVSVPGITIIDVINLIRIFESAR
jgi:hypothetical protein